MENTYAAPKAAIIQPAKSYSLIAKIALFPLLVILATACFQLTFLLPVSIPSVHFTHSGARAFFIFRELFVDLIASLPTAWLISRIYGARSLIVGGLIGLVIAVENHFLRTQGWASGIMTTVYILQTAGAVGFLAFLAEFFYSRHKL